MMMDSNNMLSPIQFETHAKAQRYAKFYRCSLCLGNLMADGTGVRCPEHGAMYRHTVVGAAQAEKIVSDTTATKIEINQIGRKPRTEEEILEDLGY
jgi:hypothetical protein